MLGLLFHIRVSLAVLLKSLLLFIQMDYKYFVIRCHYSWETLLGINRNHNQIVLDNNNY